MTHHILSTYSSVEDAVHAVEASGPYDVHTILMVLNGQHGEFDLRIEATNDDLEDYAWEGITNKYGGVSHFHRAPERRAASLKVSIA
jgi:hypothetical protein